MINYQLIKEVIALVENFDANVNSNFYAKDMIGFKRWISDNEKYQRNLSDELNWPGKGNGRNPDSEISTLIVHINRYAKTYSRSAIYDSPFTSQEDFIYLINLKAFGAMTKTELIKKNIQDKPVGMQIINRLIKQGWIEQNNSLEDKRSKIIFITPKGIEALSNSMEKIRQASQVVTGNLNEGEKLQLIKILQKLDQFHQEIYLKNIDPSQLINVVYNQFLSQNN